MSAAQALTGPRLELTAEQRERSEDATAAALRELAAELAHESQTAALQSCLACHQRAARVVAFDHAHDWIFWDERIREVHQALGLYVVHGADALASIAQGARYSIDGRAGIRAIADRLAVKLGRSREDVDEVWAALAGEREA